MIDQRMALTTGGSGEAAVGRALLRFAGDLSWREVSGDSRPFQKVKVGVFLGLTMWVIFQVALHLRITLYLAGIIEATWG